MRGMDVTPSGRTARAIVRLVVFFGLLGAIAFSAAGTLDWPMMWAFLLFYLGMMAVNVPLMDPGRLEDRALHRELDGYDKYADRARYRLIPGVW